MKPAVTVALVVILAAGALALRLPQLDRRPMHGDEAVHAVKFLGLWERGEYRYDPHEYHGPSLYFLTLPLAWLSRAQDAATLSESTLRLGSVWFGMLLVLLAATARPALGEVATVTAALLTAVSPAMVFFSRYFIHEMLLVLATFLFLVGLWRYLACAEPGWALAAGLGLGLMYATKETFVFSVVSAGLAAAVTTIWERCQMGAWPSFRVRLVHALGFVLVAGLVGVGLFSSWFTHPEGVLDSWRTYGAWLRRAEGDSPHVHPWYYYLQLLGWTHRGGGPVWTELGILLLGSWGMVQASIRRSFPWGSVGWARFLTVYTLALTLLYTVIPYKTPWCVLTWLHGWILMAGVGVASVMWSLKPVLARVGAGLGVLALCGHLTWQAWQESTTYADSQRNPWVYAHPVGSVLDLVEKVRAITAVSPQGRNTVIKVMARGGDYWPLPWYFRGYRHTGWYPSVPDRPQEAAAPVTLASPQFADDLHARFGDTQRALGYFGLRPSVFLQLHVEDRLWSRYLETVSDKPGP